MEFSIRRVANALLLVSVLAFSGTFVATGSLACFDVESCVAAAGVSSGISFTESKSAASQSTVETSASMNFRFYPDGIQLVAFYALVLSLAVLLCLEFYKPHYLKMILSSRRYSH